MPIYFNTNPLNIVDHLADRNHHGGTRSLEVSTVSPQFIVLHSTGGTDSTNWLSTTPNSQVSCQRLIKKDGTIIKIGPDNFIEWTQGPAQVGKFDGTIGHNLNTNALSIEFENLNNGTDPYPLAQLQAGVDQCIEWKGLYGDIPIVAHAWIQSDKTDPANFPWSQFYTLLFAELKKVL